MIPLPAYIDPEAWAGFCDMRRACKKPLTLRAAKMVLAELQRIKDAGHDANAALDQSTTHCWADVYAPKDKPIPAVVAPDVDRFRREADERDAKAARPPADLLARVKGALRRVA